MLFNDIWTEDVGSTTTTTHCYVQGKQKKNMYSKLALDVEIVARNLVHKNLQNEKYIGIISENTYDFLVFDLACVRLGLITIYLQEDDLFQDSDFLCVLQYVIVSKMMLHNQLNIMHVQDFFDANVPVRDAIVYWKNYEPEDVFTVTFTSGTFGGKKAIEVKCKSLDDFIVNTARLFPIVQNDKIMIFLPFSTYINRCYVYMALYYGFDMLIVPLSRFLRALNEDHPTIVVGVPYVFELFMESYQQKTNGNVFLFILDKICKCMYRAGLSPQNYMFAKAWGGSVKYLLVGSAHTSLKVLSFYQENGIILYEGYGMSEIGGMISLNTPNNYKLGSVGRPFPNKEISIDLSRQIVVKGEFFANFQYMSPSTYNDVYVDENTVNTGDIGFFDQDGYLYIDGRIKNMLVLANGRKISPEAIEIELVSIEGVRQCFVYGENKMYIVALLVIHDGADADAIRNEIEKRNQQTSEYQRIRKCYFTNEGFTIENEMLNSSLKLNRAKIVEHYRNSLDSLY